MTVKRCNWLNDDPLYIDYHDQEWGVPEYDSHRLFECLLLEGAQAGLSWYTVLKKREGYRRAFDDFDPRKMARFNTRKVSRLVADTAIVRHRGKIEAFIHNAQAYLAMAEHDEPFSDFVWSFVDGVPVQNRWRNAGDVPATTPQSDAMSKALKKRGFRFVGATTCYAFMQACGLVNDHVTDCYRHRQLKPKRRG